MDCDEEMGIGDANHKEDFMWDLVDLAPQLAALGEAVNRLPENRGSADSPVFMLCNWAQNMKADVSWFVKHRGHKLRPKNEYGDWSGQCPEKVVCGECATYQKCCFQIGHEGQHRAEAPKKGG